jgi:prevent-host-death family protein
MANVKKPPSSPPTGGAWTLTGAKARLSEVVDRAQAGPQTITRKGKPSTVIVSAEEWARKTLRARAPWPNSARIAAAQRRSRARAPAWQAS